jgi:biopolymer transport protein TolR
MAMSVPSGKSSVRAEPNVTPMIDVMLVLLIIFMIIIPSIQSGFNAVPPSGANLKPRPEEEGEQILGIDDRGQYYLNRNPIQNQNLGPMLADIYGKRTEDKVLFVRADKNLQWFKVLDALDVASHNGVRITAMISEQVPGKVSRIASDNIVPGTVTHSTGGMP